MQISLCQGVSELNLHLYQSRDLGSFGFFAVIASPFSVLSQRKWKQKCFLESG
jgi:hypothetical protein